MQFAPDQGHGYLIFGDCPRDGVLLASDHHDSQTTWMKHSTRELEMQFRWETPTRRDNEHLELRLIPNEVYLEIFSYLHPSDSVSEAESRGIFVNIASVCRFFGIHALPRVCCTLTLDARADAKQRLQNVSSLCGKAQRGDALARFISQLARTCTIANWRGRGAFVDVSEMLRSFPTPLASVTTIKGSLVKLSAPTSTLCRLALIGLSDTICLLLLCHITVDNVVELDTDNEYTISHFAASEIPLRRLTIPRLGPRSNTFQRLAEWLGAFKTLREFTLTHLDLGRLDTTSTPPTFPLQASALPSLRKLTCPASIASHFGTNTRPHLTEAALVGETVAFHIPVFFRDLSTFRVDNLCSLAIPFYCLKPTNAPFNMPYPALERLIIQNQSYKREMRLSTTIQDLIVICEASSFLPPILDLEFRFSHDEEHDADTGALLVDLGRQRVSFGNVAQFCFPTVEKITITPYICWRITNGNWQPKVLNAALMKTAMNEFPDTVVDYDGCLEGL